MHLLRKFLHNSNATTVCRLLVTLYFQENVLNNPIVIRKGLKLGELDAEADKDLLLSCFIDTGELSRLMSVDDPAAIVLGRTGSGKSALLLKINETAEHSVFLDPNDISIRFLGKKGVQILL